MADCFDPKLTASDRVAAYFEQITGRPMTRAEKIPLGAVIHGESIEDADLARRVFASDYHVQRRPRVQLCHGAKMA